jgi:Cu+-exporting ATPase
VVAFAPATDELVLQAAAAAEAASEHPLGDAIIEGARAKGLVVAPAAWFEAVPGQGIKARGAGFGDVLVGNRRLMQSSGVALGGAEKVASALEARGYTVALVAIDGEIAGALAVADPVKEGSAEAVAALHAMGIEVILLTGDNPATAQAVAQAVGIREVAAEVLPQGKAEVIRQLKAQGKTVAMIGDGINDAPAMAAADVGIAIGSGTDVAKEAGGIVLVRGDLRDAVAAIQLSSKTFQKIKQNLFWAFGFNVAGIPVAAGVLYPAFGILLDPIVAGAAMAFSSVAVVTNANLLKAYVPPIRRQRKGRPRAEPNRSQGVPPVAART